MDEVHRELRRKGVTLQLVWEEYHRAHPEGYAYTQFWEYYRRFCAQLEPALRQPHPAGERMFVDWAGLTIPLFDPQTGQIAARVSVRRGAGRQQLHLSPKRSRTPSCRPGSKPTFMPGSSLAAWRG